MTRAHDRTLDGFTEREKKDILMLRRLFAERRYEELKKARREKQKKENSNDNEA